MAQIRLCFLITHHLLLTDSLPLPGESLVVFLSVGWVPAGVKLWDCLVAVHPQGARRRFSLGKFSLEQSLNLVYLPFYLFKKAFKGGDLTCWDGC